MAKILHKRLVATSVHPLQIKSIDKVNLCIPALRFESALTDVVVAGRAREGKVVGHQGLKLTLVLFPPCLIPPRENFFVCRALLGPCARPCRSQEPRRSSQCASSRFE